MGLSALALAPHNPQAKEKEIKEKQAGPTSPFYSGITPPLPPPLLPPWSLEVGYLVGKALLRSPCGTAAGAVTSTLWRPVGLLPSLGTHSLVRRVGLDS